MFSLRFLLQNLFLDYSGKDLDDLVLLCEKTGLDYDINGWKKVKKINLSELHVKISLVKTLFQSQYNSGGIANEIMMSLESWTGGMLDFVFLSENDRLFYRTIYILFGFLSFLNISPRRQVYLLNGRALIIGLVIGIDILGLLQDLFSRFNFVLIAKNESKVFSLAIANNGAEVELENKKRKISEWISDYGKFVPAVEGEKIDLFILNNFKVDNKDSEVLSKIIYLYDQLSTDKIWKDLKYSTGPYEKTDKKEVSLEEQENYYLELLKESDQFFSWLEDYKNVTVWLKEKKPEFLKKLWTVAKEKTDLNDEKQLELLSQFSSLLQEEKIYKDDLIYFDESAGKFVWNEKLWE